LETLKLAGAILGGLGLFLLAVGMMTDGLKQAAGTSLRTLLSQWSKTPLRGVFSGFFMTAVVQSSSAVTVASLGFVNAGLINMRQALGIVYGANIGTTMTAWLVALIGFKLDIPAFALPMIGLGMVIKLIKNKGQAASFGLALVGFGLFFLGVDVLKSAFESVVLAFDISSYTADGISGIFILFLVGMVMTILTQSSSASIALTITAASSGMIDLYAAGAMVIGANIGTTSTAILASIGATSNAKRVAAAQVIFNFVTALVALFILPALFFLIAKFSQFFGLSANPAISLAMFHTIFNILGVLLVYPQNNRIASFLEKRFLTWEEKESHPRFIDQNIAQTPVLAVNALILEMQAIADKVISVYAKAIDPAGLKLTEFENEVKVIKSLTTQISHFIVSIKSESLADETTINLSILMRIEQYFLSCTHHTQRIAEQLTQREKLDLSALESDSTQLLEHVLTFMHASRLNRYDSVDLFNEQFSLLQSEYESLKESLLLAGTRSQISVAQMSETLNCLVYALEVAQQWYKALIRLQNIQNEIESEEGTELQGDTYDESIVNI